MRFGAYDVSSTIFFPPRESEILTMALIPKNFMGPHFWALSPLTFGE
ncbi:MAG: hypothetical protein CM15mP2_1480 [Methanobacteriota archaeon]|nr:MAG: hypothetical protein CM15mP2_1480 [Euryarchaeota archaeon]